MRPLKLHEIGLFGELIRRPNPHNFVIRHAPNFERLLPFLEQQLGQRLQGEECEQRRNAAPAIVLTAEEDAAMRNAEEHFDEQNRCCADSGIETQCHEKTLPEMRYIIEDEAHAAWLGEFDSFDGAFEELFRFASLPWDSPPNVAPCNNWKACGREYSIVHYDTSARPWREIERVPTLAISAAGVRWDERFMAKAKEFEPDAWMLFEELHGAAQDGDLPRVNSLLKRWYPVNRFDELGKTPLHYAVREGHLQIVDRLIEAGADVNANDEATIGNTPLSDNVEECSYAVLKRLVDAGADPTIRGWMNLNAIDRASKRTDADASRVQQLLNEAVSRRKLRQRSPSES